jgi:hypothetical protein
MDSSNDRHCGVFHRPMTRRGRLYTEMLTTGAVLHRNCAGVACFRRQRTSSGVAARRLGPLRGQRRSARISAMTKSASVLAAPWDLTGDGRFGACLMTEPALVGGHPASRRRLLTGAGCARYRHHRAENSVRPAARLDCFARCRRIGRGAGNGTARHAWLTIRSSLWSI